MSKLVWDQVSEHLYETGVDHGVLYTLNENKEYKNAHAWNGLTGITESPSGADETKLWADNIKYLSLRAAEEFGGTIEAYTYPDAFAECDGSASLMDGVFIGQQSRKVFGLSYRTILGNDTEMNDHGYKLHLIYGCTCNPTQRAYATVNDSPEAITFSWEFSTTPVEVANHKPTACITIDSTKVTAEALTRLEDHLYGTDPEGQAAGTSGWLPLPDDVVKILNGTYTG